MSEEKLFGRWRKGLFSRRRGRCGKGCDSSGFLYQKHKKRGDAAQDRDYDHKQAQDAHVHPLGKRRIGFSETGSAGEKRAGSQGGAEDQTQNQKYPECVAVHR